jgi:hypothetical protein
VGMSAPARLSRALVRCRDTCWVVVAGLAGWLGVVAAWRAAGAGGVLSVFMAGAAVGFAIVTPWMATAPWRSARLLVAGPGLGVLSC